MYHCWSTLGYHGITIGYNQSLYHDTTTVLFPPSASLYCTYSSTRSFPCATFSSARSPFPVTLNCRQSSGAYGAETEACNVMLDSKPHPPSQRRAALSQAQAQTDWLAGAGADCCKYRICARFCGITFVTARVLRGNCEGIMMSPFDWYIVAAERRNVTMLQSRPAHGLRKSSSDV